MKHIKHKDLYITKEFQNLLHHNSKTLLAFVLIVNNT